MKITMYEPCSADDAGSIGAWYIAEHARRAGYPVEIVRRPRKCDIELISLHHCLDFPRLAALPRYGKIRIVGGHPMQNNPRPVIPFTDIVCIGEGETWIKKALPLLEKFRSPDCLADLPGTILSSKWHVGDPIPASNIEQPLPDNPPYLNREEQTRKKAWYIEIARGCPYRCAFCEIGWSMPFRYYSTEHLKSVLAKADTSITRKINFYAPDEISHPHYHELFAYLKATGYSASFSSMRIDSILKRGLPDIKPNHLVRVGIDGLTEETRRRVNKPITNEMIIEYFRRFVERGHIYFKMFYIFGYPWEEPSDFDEFEELMNDLRTAIQPRKNLIVRIKWTPFVPQPCTPLAHAKAKYDYKMVDRINVWHALNDRPRDRRKPGWYFSADGIIMGEESHRRQCELTAGDETILLREFKPLHKPR